MEFVLSLTLSQVIQCMCIFFSNLAQLKDLLALIQLKPPNSYDDQHLTHQFFPSAIEIFGCLHKQAHMF
jgi:hypothetical protein